MPINSSSTLRQIIRVRPLAVEILEAVSAHACWDHLEQPLVLFCRTRNLDDANILHRIAALPQEPAESDWKKLPLYHLIDFLTMDHVGFRLHDLGVIGKLLDTPDGPTYPDKYVLKLIIQEFRYFEEEFIKHMEEEETFLFPKIMRNEACFRYPELSPEIHKGSVNLYFTLQPHKPEDEFKRMLTSIREKLRLQSLRHSTETLTQQIQSALESFERKLIEHGNLETEILFPLAGRLEQELYENSAPGLSRFPGDF